MTNVEDSTEELELLDRISVVGTLLLEVIERERRGLPNNGMYNGDDDVVCGVAAEMVERCERLMKLRSNEDDE